MSLLLFLVLSIFGYFTIQSSKAVLNNCTAITFNTAFPPNNCEPVSCTSLGVDAKTPDDPSGNYNCYYAPQIVGGNYVAGGKPLMPCKKITDTATKKPRENCADIIDLPLCNPPIKAGATTIPFVNPIPGKNCVLQSKEIADPNPASNPRKVRGVDYAVHNQDSIRFCGKVEACGVGEICDSNVINDANKCSTIKCHQLTSADTPNSANLGNCSILTCNLLTLDEFKVGDGRFFDPDKKYCDGDNVKCYNFFNNSTISESDSSTNNSDNLKYIQVRPLNPMCKIHDCQSTITTCGVDDIANITTKGAAYENDYIKYINATFPLTQGLCHNLDCKPVVDRQYRCLPMDNITPTTLNSNCDTAQSCIDGYCKKKIDCNCDGTNNADGCKRADNSIIDNRSHSECLPASGGEVSSDVDPFNSWLYRPTPSSNMNRSNINTSGLCYYKDQMKANGWGWDGDLDLGIFNIPLGYFHNGIANARSPGSCDISRTKLGTRGVGYGNLCGTDGNIFKNPREDFGYIRGFAKVNYDTPQNPKYIITACLRYQNTGRLNACGERECGIDCAFGSCKTQWCGRDVCDSMTIEQNNLDECSYTVNQPLHDAKDLSTNNDFRCTSSTIDTYVRMRARKYGRRICVFVDHKGAVAYDNKNYHGTEKLSDGTCIEERNRNSVTDPCNGFNTNQTQGLADRWRTVKRIQYIGSDPQLPSKKGYIDLDGRFFAEQECAMIPLRIGPPSFFNVATVKNSSNLFEPPVYIRNVMTKRGGGYAENEVDQLFGSTDFFQPEIEVKFGSVTQKMSLGMGFVGEDDIPESPVIVTSPPSATLTSTVEDVPRKVEVFVKKEYSDDKSQPMFCLYHRIYDQFGAPINPAAKIDCVRRNLPEISGLFNSTSVKFDSITGNQIRMKAIIEADAANVYNKAKLKLKLFAEYGIDGKYNKCVGDDVCTAKTSTNMVNMLDNWLVFENVSAGENYETCYRDIENHKFCSARDECSALFYECSTNEIDLNNANISAIVDAQALSLLKFKRNECAKLVTKCKRKMGISASDDIINSYTTQINSLIRPITPDGQLITPIKNRYGWFNEICITKGFEKKFRKILAYQKINGDVAGKCLVDIAKSKAGADCSLGGKAPDCICAEVSTPSLPCSPEDPNCVEDRLETPHEAGLCIDIKLPKFCPIINYSGNTFKQSSIDNAIRNDIVGLSYDDVIGVHSSHQVRSQSITHSEYGLTIAGMSNVNGECNGFWKYQSDTLKPMLNCSSNGVWQIPTGTNYNCIRYSCDAINTSWDDSTNSYKYQYADGETGESRGNKNGFARWPSYNKTNDFAQLVNATSCIDGYKPSGSTLNGSIFTGGVLPVRYCKQDGEWHTPKTYCERVKCPAIKPTTNAEWLDNGGALVSGTTDTAFSNNTPASRSKTNILPESVETAIACNNAKGFWHLTNTAYPSRTCNYLGQWGSVQNACSRLDCSVVTDANSGNNDGWAVWPLTEFVPTNSAVNVRATSCKTGYIANPNIAGSPLPSRDCQSVSVVEDGISKWKTAWQPPVNPCINKCPTDITTVSTSTGSKLISWTETQYGDIAYVNNNTNLNASFFALQNRTNGFYVLKRKCGDGNNGIEKGKWGPVEPMCVANGGNIGNAIYRDDFPATTANADSITAGGTDRAIGTCLGGYESDGESPVMQCLFKDSNNYIDQTYLALADQTKYCKLIICNAANAVNTNTYPMLATQNSRTMTIGSSIHLSCASGYILDGPAPTAICNSDKTFDVKNAGSCRAAIQCQSDGPISNPEGRSCGCDVDWMRERVVEFNKEMFPLNHGYRGTWKGRYRCSDNWEATVECKDGTTEFTNFILGSRCDGDPYIYD